MAPKVHIWARDRSARLLLDIDEVFIDAQDIIVGDVIRVGVVAWTVTDVQHADGVTELTIEPPSGDTDGRGRSAKHRHSLARQRDVSSRL